MDFGVGQVGGADVAAEGGADAAFAAPPRFPVLVGLAGLQSQPGGQDSADVGQPADRGPGGRVGPAGQFHPGGGEPAPGRAGTEGAGLGAAGVPPAGHDTAQPVRADVQGGGQQVKRCAKVLGAEHQPGDVPAGELDRPGISPAAGQSGRVRGWHGTTFYPPTGA